jgi:hypothetical protein
LVKEEEGTANFDLLKPGQVYHPRRWLIWQYSTGGRKLSFHTWGSLGNKATIQRFGDWDVFIDLGMNSIFAK